MSQITVGGGSGGGGIKMDIEMKMLTEFRPNIVTLAGSLSTGLDQTRVAVILSMGI